ncbi:hypothetical protein KVP09_07175 [Alcaligenaceae bacterium CGII-47]|nr:hypothetical protein [Alcaligenaceae bacterium CGII-47]
MTTEPTLLPNARDHALLRNILLKLTATQKIIATAVVVIVTLIWYDLLNRLLAFGGAIDYAALHVLGAEGSALLQRYNPFFWWATIVLCTIIIAYFLYLFVRSTAQRTRQRPIDQHSVTQLCQGLSAPALDVLLWAWQNRSEPLRIGDLQRTRNELRAHRATKLQHAARQLAMIEEARRKHDPI